ncbi:uncharacterized protein PHALS_13306 [Plasmopara halstedii]|uniref:Uncharacterized protein n=1 Tax=Plasmopara halstedii TaxID=4781 RepID=A0A0P1ANW6_PLAHL|nr:uncharacterized protein PHALS_13306 [Plasmopara halstedii]CEG43088.1 hypothetical protein PHALS_13306 [Plasmopara halstedii]|eukprot:XP_024579457.1 hypothetical protein PHALS_13306 [Plasmopara halstedii]
MVYHSVVLNSQQPVELNRWPDTLPLRKVLQISDRKEEPGGLKAGDIGIYQYFKDISHAEINAWKESDQTDGDAVVNSIIGAGFADSYQDWFVARHDVNGTLFRKSYKTDCDSSVDADVFNFDVLDEALDEIGVVIDE